MYRATTSFTTNDYDVRYKQILEDDFASQEEIDEFLRIGYIEVYDDTIDITENGIYDVEDYQNADVNVSGGEVNLQSKDISINTNGTTTVTADQGYDGLSDVDVTVSGILDTSDATAIPLNIKSGQTAYAKGEKIIGTLPVLTYPIDPIDPSNWDYQFIRADGSLKNVTRDGVDYITGGHTVVSNAVESWMFEGNSKMKMGFSHDKIASVAGLSANKLKKGETVLGVTGTYEGEGGTKVVLPNGIRFSSYTTASDFSWLADVDTSNLTTTEKMFYYCSKIITVPLFDTSNVTDFGEMFAYNTGIVTSPQFDTSKANSIYYMFRSCTNLVNVPIFNTSNLGNGMANFNDTFKGCPNLSNESLNNILAMCIAAVKITGTDKKTLKYIGLSQTQAQTCQTLSNWDDFVAAGWTTGY